VARYGFCVTRRPVPVEGLDWWVRVRMARAWRHEFALRQAPSDPAGWARERLAATAPAVDWIEYADAGTGQYRAAWFSEDRLEGFLAWAGTPALPAREWLAERFAAECSADDERLELLAGRPLARSDEGGPTVCACLSVGRDTILAAIMAGDLRTPREVGERVRAGSNCGSCVPEIRGLIEQCRRRPDAA
jgi:assimilatory nitrate reductase catalytic subunit